MRKILSFFILLFVTAISAFAASEDYTSAIVNADLSTNEGWDATGTKGISGGAVKVGSRANFDFTQTIHLVAGQYKLIAQAAYRFGGDEQAEYDAITAGKNTKLVELYAGDAKVAVKNRWEGATDAVLEGTSAVAVNDKYVPNSSNDVVTYMKAGQYDNELVFNVTKEGDIKIGIRRVDVPENDVTDYTNISAWKLYRLGDAESEPQTVTVSGITYAIKGQNLFANGSFDNGVEGWKTIGYATDAVASNFTINAEGGFDNGAYIVTNGGGTGSDKTIRQAVAVEAGKTYYFSVYTSGKAPTSNNFNYNALFKMSNATTENGVLKSFEWPQGANETATEWSQTEYVFTADEANPYVGVRMGWNESSAFDGFTLVEVEQTTSPLDAAKATALAAIDALPIGDALFLYSQSAYETACAAINAATTVEEVNAVAMPTANLPKADAKYVFKNVNTGLYLTASDKGISIETEPAAFTFETTEGGYYLNSGEYYVGLAGNDGWSMASTADKKTVITFGAQTIPGGCVYTIKEAKGAIGTDGTDAGSTCYADKNADKNGLWTIEEYVEPVGVAFSFTYNTDGQTPVALAFGSAKGGVKYGVDFGDGNVVETEEIAQSTALSTKNQITGVPVATDGVATISVYADPADIASLSISASIATDDPDAATKRDANRVASIDGSKLTALNQLSLNYAAFETIDLAPFTSLTVVNMMYGKLKNIDLTTCPTLTNANLTANALETIKVAGMEKVSYLNLNDNPALKKLDVSNMPALANLYAQQNAAGVKGELTEVDMTGNTTTLTWLYLSNNKIQKLNIPVTVANFEATNNEISEFSVVNATKSCKIEGNKLTFATLPVKPAGISSTSKLKKFTYAPQADLAVEDITTEDVLDLSAQLSAVGENTIDNDPAKEAGEATTTTYTFKAGETDLVEGTDYTVVEPGKFKFTKVVENVVCTMTNTAFPKFADANAFKTVAFNVNVPAVKYTGIVEQTLSHPAQGVMGTTTTEQTVSISEAGEGLVNVTFSGFTTPVLPFVFAEFTIENVTATANGDVTTYAATGFTVKVGMAPYTGVLEGVKNGDATPVFHLTLTNATVDEVYFGADQAAIDAYKTPAPAIALAEGYTAITSADELEGWEVVLMNASTGDYVYVKENQNVSVGDFATATASTNAVVAFKAEKNETGFLFRAVTPAGGDYSLWGHNPCYLNGQTDVNGVVFTLGLQGQNGTDVVNGAVWTLEPNADNTAFAIKNVASGAYVNGTNTSMEPVYFVIARKSDATNAIATISATSAKAGKYMENGKLVIVKNGVKYNTAGQTIK